MKKANKINLKNIYTKNFFTKFFYFLFLVLSFNNTAFAADLSLTPSSGNYNVGDNFSVKLRVSSPSASINAVSSGINFSNDTIVLSSISKAGSVITLWPVEPSFVNQAGSASIDGVAISGFTGNSGTVVTLNFRAVKEGPAYVRFSGASVLANDGSGTNVLQGSSSASFTINKKEISVIEPKEPVIKKVQIPQITNLPNVIKIQQIESSVSEPGRSNFIITPPRPAKNNTYSIQIDSEKIFSYIDDGAGVYTTPILGDGNHTIRVSAQDEKGVNMIGLTEFTVLPIDGVIVESSFKNNLMGSSRDLVVYMFAIIGALVLVLVIGFIKIRKDKKSLNKKIIEAKKTINKAFNLLEEDEGEEARLIRKLKSKKMLTEDDEATIDQFSKDLGDAEKVITESLNEIKDE